jgi:hypothetical protein
LRSFRKRYANLEAQRGPAAAIAIPAISASDMPMAGGLAWQKPSAPKLTDAQRHKRFVAMAHEVEASESPKAFDKAFKLVARARPVARPKKN